MSDIKDDDISAFLDEEIAREAIKRKLGISDEPRRKKKMSKDDEDECEKLQAEVDRLKGELAKAILEIVRLKKKIDSQKDEMYQSPAFYPRLPGDELRP